MKNLLAVIGLAMFLNGCTGIKAYRNFQKNVGQFVNNTVDGKVDCPLACEAIKQYVKDRYGISK